MASPKPAAVATAATGPVTATAVAAATPSSRRKEPSSHTKDKASAAKAYIEAKYSMKKSKEEEKKQGWQQLQTRMNEMNLSSTEQELIRNEILQREAQQMREARRKITIYDFQPVAIIGKGAFGEVRVVRHKQTGEILAMKKMNKNEMVYKNQVQHVRAEKEILSLAKCEWIVDLKYSFQDEMFLYLVMEYLPGGDLMTLLIRKDILSEDESRFYIAETILALESVHNLNYIHRDLKPDNVILDVNGHVKLSDFGLCKHADIYARNPYENLSKLQEDQRYKHHLEKKSDYQRNRQLAYSTVGTPDYIAPEVFGRGGYDHTVDWWSVGVILFEMLVGYPPFFSDEPSITCQKILHWRKTLQIPKEANLSIAATDILKRLICDAENRLGRNGVDEIKNHPFFYGINWSNMKAATAPNVPQLTCETDTCNFDHFEETEPFYPPQDTASQKRQRKQRKDANFVGYTYKKDQEQMRPQILEALDELDKINQASVESSVTPPLVPPVMEMDSPGDVGPQQAAN